MSDQQQPDTNEDAARSMELANEIINLANGRLEQRMSPVLIATGLRHAAANFSAFVYHQSGGGGDEVLSATVGDFVQAFEFYLDRHAPAPAGPAGGLSDLINQAKNEI